MHAAILTIVITTGAPPHAYEYAGPNGLEVRGGVSGTATVTIDEPVKYVYRSVKNNFLHMPQTCYSPRFGCYPGNNREMHRYPAFHGTFYRRPYNYRNLFDYPWHAELHEPTSHLSYNSADHSRDTSRLRGGRGMIESTSAPGPWIPSFDGRRPERRRTALAIPPAHPHTTKSSRRGRATVRR